MQSLSFLTTPYVHPSLPPVRHTCGIIYMYIVQVLLTLIFYIAIAMRASNGRLCQVLDPGSVYYVSNKYFLNRYRVNYKYLLNRYRVNNKYFLNKYRDNYKYFLIRQRMSTTDAFQPLQGQ